MRILRYGDTGPAVQLLQLALNRAGFGTLLTDGIFGEATGAALREFQRAQGLRIDGVAGAQTQRALLPWYTGYVCRVLRPGDTFYALAQRYGTTAEFIALANPGLVPENLPVGGQIVVPLPFPVVPTGIDWCSALVAYCVRGLAARFPFLRVGQFGSSELGRPLWQLSLGEGSNRVFYSACHHANEWITAPVLLCWAEELAWAFALGGTVAGHSAGELLDYATVRLAPCVNPDGLDLVTGELRDTQLLAPVRRIAAAYPRYPFPDGWKANIRGTDLNLQYPAGWERARENKFAQGITSPAPADYVGPAPLSASEARALYRATAAFDPALVIALHTQGEVVYWRYLDHEPPQGRAIAEAFFQVSGYRPDDAPYASGFAGYKDWFIDRYDRPGFTVEAGRGRNPLPLSDFPDIYEACRAILTLGALVT